MITAEQISRYAELPLAVESELGRRMLPMREVMALSVGSIIRLPVPSGSNVQVLVGEAPFAAGEVVRIGKTPAIRLLSFSKAKSD
jgi:flagellar motor switch/type III secretory pathway protein FliN